MTRREKQSDNVIQFERGCRRCANLVRMGRNTYMCNARANMDDSSIFPIKDGEVTEYWNICEGEDYHFIPRPKSRSQIKSS